MSNDARNQSVFDIVGADFFVRLVDAFYDGVQNDQVLIPLYPEGEDTVGARHRLALCSSFNIGAGPIRTWRSVGIHGYACGMRLM
jgi:truncated hemoglobin YjbI